MKLGDMVRNVLTRSQFFRQLVDQRRDIDKECGYPLEITTEEYKYKFKRGDIASRVVSLYPEACWAEPPLIYETEDEEETEFERRWNRLQGRFRLHSLLQRADRLSGIGRFGIILLGINDDQTLDKPVAGLDAMGQRQTQEGTNYKLLYLRTFDESFVRVMRLEEDVKNPRYGLPVEYEIQFALEQMENGSPINPGMGAGTNGSVTTTKKVHWHRVIHLADNKASDEVYGMPRMQVVYDRLLDLKKIAGGSGEMFWKGGFPGLSLETPLTDPSGVAIELDVEATKEQVLAYQEGLQRHLALQGVEAKSLQPNVADPSSHLEVQIRLVSIGLACPWRVLMGAETGQLASGQDMVAWNKRMNNRREDYVTPQVIRPFIDRLIVLGVLPFPEGDEPVELEEGEPPAPQYIVHWTDLNTPSDEEKATVAEKRTNAMSKYVAGGVDQLIAPKHYLVNVIGFSDQEAEAMLDEVGDRLIVTDPEAEHERSLEKIGASAAARAQAGADNRNGFQQNSNAPLSS